MPLLTFLASLGEGDTQRARLLDAMELISNHERALGQRLYNGLYKLKGIKLHGPNYKVRRSPTLAFTLEGKTAAEVCTQLAAHNICAWDGHFYAIRATEILGLLEKGGVTRMGISLYNTEEDVDRTLEVVEKICKH